MSTFTILIATYNVATLLPRTLDSLAVQTCHDFNVIIQDGASSDDTIAVAQSYVEKLPALLLHSEADTGIYDAWNKALGRWQDKLGEWVLFLGAGDELYDCEVLQKAKEKICSLPKERIYASGYLQLVRKDSSFSDLLPACPLRTSPKFQMPPHPALFHRKILFLKNRFATSYTIAGDTDFLLRTWPSSEDGYATLSFVVTRMARGGVSDNPKAIGRIRYEILRAKMLHCKMSLWALCIESVGVLKGYMITSIYMLFAKKAPNILNAICKICGKEPRWKYDEL